jgi:hypothetical protein
MIITYSVLHTPAFEMQREYWVVVSDYNPHPDYLQRLGGAYNSTLESMSEVSAEDAIQELITKLKLHGVSGKLRKYKA